MLPLLAQRNNNAANGPPDEFLAVFIGIMCVALLIGLIIAIFFLLTLQKALARCSPRNRTMEPGMVWLNLIPLFSIVWEFITVIRVAESLQNEFRSRGWHRRGEEYGKGLGIAFCALNLASIIPYLGSCFGLAGFICWIIYWVKIAGYSGQLASGAARYDDDYDDDEDDEEDDRRGRRDRDDDRDDRDDRDDDDDRGRKDKPWDRGGR